MFTNSDYVVSVGGLADVDAPNSAPELKRRSTMQHVVPMQIQVQYRRLQSRILTYTRVSSYTCVLLSAALLLNRPSYHCGAVNWKI